MLLTKLEVKHILLRLVGHGTNSKAEKATIKKFIHKANYDGPFPDLSISLSRSECRILYESILKDHFIPRDNYQEILDIIHKVRNCGGCES